MSSENIWWADGQNGSDNKAITPVAWDHLKDLAIQQLDGKSLYIVDAFVGANKATRMSVRVVTEVAWFAHFAKNMFIRLSQEEEENFKPDWTILHACKTTNADFAKYNMNSEVFAVFNLKQSMTVIGGTWYGGEIKKGMFSMMNYYLPLKGIGSFHCSANVGNENDSALFFGLSGTGKTTLSADPSRRLIGDDEHGWDDEGIFNLEGGCYAKTIDLSEDKEPDIFRAIRRDALLENVDVNTDGSIDYSSDAKTKNTRVSYPIYHIDNIVKPVSSGPHPKVVIFLTCDAFGVLPPVSRLSKEQAEYHYLSGYTAKVAGTELGVKEPTPSFSSCFGQPFLTLHPTKYGEILSNKVEKHNARVYLVNTGWTGGPVGVGNRVNLKQTRAMITAILNGSVENAEFETLPIFNLDIPKEIENVDSSILNPRNTWDDKEAYDQSRDKLATMFIDNFKKFTDNDEGKKIELAGPSL